LRLNIASTAVFRKTSDARYRNVGGEGVVVRQAAGEVLVLSEVGARVLDLIETGAPIDRMLTVLAEEYDIDAAILEKDVMDYLQELLEAGIIEGVGT
jgi:Coenzyme PQQ synthesis protein D (PqqD)